MNAQRTEELAKLAQTGDRDAADTLLQSLRPVVLHSIKPYYLADYDKDDLFSIAWEAAWKAIQDWRPSKSPFLPFLLLVVRRKIIAAVRTQTRQARYAQLAPISLDAQRQAKEQNEPFGQRGNLRGLRCTPSAEEEYLCALLECHDFWRSLSTTERLVAQSRLLHGKEYGVLVKRGLRYRTIDNAHQRVKAKLRRWLAKERELVGGSG